MLHVVFWMAVLMGSVSWAETPEDATAKEESAFNAADYLEVTIKQLQPKKRVKPVYPAAAKSKGLTAKCDVRLFIDEQGVPVRADSECTNLMFKDSASEAAMKWTFHPYKAEEKPTKVQFVLQLKYDMQ